jgi:hypothetical protein
VEIPGIGSSQGKLARHPPCDKPILLTNRRERGLGGKFLESVKGEKLPFVRGEAMQ